MNQLFVYGDSWPWGVGLDDPAQQSFPVLSGKLLQLETKNWSMPATSIDHMVYAFLNNCKENLFNPGDKILFCVTSKHRSMCFDHTGRKLELHPLGITETEKIYHKYIHTEYLADYNLQKNILLCKLMCDSMDIKSYFISGWEHIPTNLQMGCNFYPLTLLGILHPERNGMFEGPNSNGEIWNSSPYLYDHRHPNIEGHRKIAEELAKWIN